MIMISNCNSNVCVLILLLITLSFLVYDLLIILKCSRA